MVVRIIDRFDSFLKLKMPWNELSASLPDDHAYMRHEWFEHWLSSQEMTGHLHMITGWQDGHLVGVLPLVWKTIQLRGMSFRCLRFAESAVSPRCNALVHGSQELSRLVDRLASVRACQLIELQHLEADSPTTQLLLGQLSHDSPLRVHTGPGRQSPYLKLDCSWDEYMSRLSGHRRTWIRGNVKKLKGDGRPYEFRFISNPSEADFLIDALIQISSRSWKADVGTAIAQVPTQLRLYTDFTPVGLVCGLVEGIVLVLDNRPIAIKYSLKLGRKYVGIRTDFDKDFARLRPGENIHAAHIQRLADSGSPAEVDFGGVSTDDKLRWANTMRPHIVIHAARLHWRGILLVAWKKLRDRRRNESEQAGHAAPETDESATSAESSSEL